eukprot:3932894-Rhodomonas_salina.2
MRRPKTQMPSSRTRRKSFRSRSLLSVGQVRLACPKSGCCEQSGADVECVGGRACAEGGVAGREEPDAHGLCSEPWLPAQPDRHPHRRVPREPLFLCPETCCAVRGADGAQARVVNQELDFPLCEVEAVCMVLLDPNARRGS